MVSFFRIVESYDGITTVASSLHSHTQPNCQWRRPPRTGLLLRYISFQPILLLALRLTFDIHNHIYGVTEALVFEVL